MTTPHDVRSLFLEGPEGRLEAILWTPVRKIPPPFVALVCHPHPLFGGTMHNKVVYQVARTLDRLRLPVLRFNFRGAGLSAGVHDKGIGEQGDVRAALTFLSRKFPDAPLLLAGFSFGCWVGLRVGCKDARVTELIGLGAPVNDSDFSYLTYCAKPKLFVHGSEDQYGARDKVEQLVASLLGDNRLEVIEGADHFFTGKLDLLDSALSAWLVARHPGLAV